MAFRKGRGFGKLQKADEDFRKKKKDGDSSGRSEGRSERPRRTRTGTGGSSYSAGKRKFSAGPRDEKRSFRKDEGGGGEKRSFRPRRDDEGKRPFRPRRDDGEGKRPFRARRDDDNKRPFGKKKFEEKRSFVESKVQRHRERVEEPAPESTESTKASRAAKAIVGNADGLIRLNKFISNSGVCSRREADDLIKMGLITVNGTTITEMGYKVKPTDDVRHDGKKLTAEKPVYILLNKPKGFITTTDDPQERNTVMELIAGACKERVYPVGRLDRN
ncbi:MAG TPA: S4 domain-containing protein, partial [Cyclobacteriaceae bacterium]|nr:S4 domain-containing protein [Cyclobacteriaceae bacterium]